MDGRCEKGRKGRHKMGRDWERVERRAGLGCKPKKRFLRYVPRFWGAAFEECGWEALQKTRERVTKRTGGQMAQRKIHGSNAERQAAYRERQKRNAAKRNVTIEQQDLFEPTAEQKHA